MRRQEKRKEKKENQPTRAGGLRTQPSTSDTVYRGGKKKDKTFEPRHFEGSAAFYCDSLAMKEITEPDEQIQTS